MTTYLIKLALTLPLVAAMAWCSLWLWRRHAPALRALGQGQGWGGGQGDAVPLGLSLAASARITGAVPMGLAGRLIVVEFGGQSHLVAVTRQTIVPIASASPAPAVRAAA